MGSVIAVDLGTTRVKAARYGLDGSPQAVAVRSRSVELTAEGHALQDVEHGWTLQCEVVREVAAADGIEALVLTHQRGTFAPADAEGRALGPHIVWMDRRGLPVVADLERRWGGAFYDRFMLPVMPYTGLSKMLWLERNGAAAERYLPAHTLHAARMTGTPPVCDPSTASFLGPWNIRNGCWDAAFCADEGLPVSRLPEIVPSTTIVGGILPEIAAELGLPSGTPVVLGAADGQAAAVGTGCTAPGVIMVNVGTATGVQAYLDAPRPHPDRALVTGAHAWPGAFEMEGHTQAAAAAFDWLTGLLGAGTPEETVALAGSVPAGADGVMIVPTMNGLSAPISRPEAAGSIHGLRLRHGRAHLVRAMLEGLAFEIRWLMEALQRAVPPTERIVVAGGLTQVDWFCAVLASVLGRPVTRVRSDPAMAGIAAIAALATGHATDGFVRFGDETASTPADAAVYDRAFGRFVERAAAAGAGDD